ncbi:hypothetical protein [Phaffia rhodozyma]|uniref:Uncharacterized protein n=1 Tax=Phaffia rhodozyma TaxID=264483 RepID=A0A0F7SS45_PHARH|nr:hypothetical protein [Phaffia rhodozyma]
MTSSYNIGPAIWRNEKLTLEQAAKVEESQNESTKVMSSVGSDIPRHVLFKSKELIVVPDDDAAVEGRADSQAAFGNINESEYIEFGLGKRSEKGSNKVCMLARWKRRR